MNSSKLLDRSIAVVGLGYGGLPLALLADHKGYHVTGIDTNTEKISSLKKRKAPFQETFVTTHLPASHLELTTNFKQIRNASIIVICVPTPVYDDRTPDLEPLTSACKSIAPFLEKGQLVILESTVNPGVSETIVLPILEKRSGLKGGTDFSLAHCPERVNPGDKTWNVENIPRVVGAIDHIGLQKALSFYRSIMTGEVKPMSSIQEAEAVKVVENSFRDINIAFVNELAESFSRLGIDVVKVIEGASTKPFGFTAFYPGCGVGGHCIPVDPYYLIQYAKENGFTHRFLSLAREINEDMPKFVIRLLEEGLANKGLSIKGLRIAVLGLAYKADIEDCRESPAFPIIEELIRRGAIVSAYDPYVPQASTAKSLGEALATAQAVVIATAHQLFTTELTPEVAAANDIQVIVDGRNCLPKEMFLGTPVLYKGVGR